MIGYAIEALAKGMIVATDPEAAGALQSHDLAGLLERADVPLDKADRALAEKLYHHIKWIGRYPAPTLRDARLFQESSQAAGHWMFGPGAIISDDYRQARGLYERVRDLLEAQLDDQP